MCSSITWNNRLFIGLTIGLFSSPVAAIQFNDASNEAGIAHISETYGASWGELNGDGWPDIFVGNHRMPPIMFRNNGDGTFSNVTQEIDASGTWTVKLPNADTHGATWADFDNDGDQDIMVATGGRGGEQFFVNEGGVLHDRTVEFDVGGVEPSGRLPIWLDYNDDGRLDFLMMYWGGTRPADFYRQIPGPGFVLDDSAGLNCRSAQYGQLVDLDDNNRLELLCGPGKLFPDRVYDLGFEPALNVTSGVPQMKRVNDSATADFDGDLRVDLFEVIGTSRPSEAILVGSKRVESQLLVSGENEKIIKFTTSGVISVKLDWNRLSSKALYIGSGGYNPQAKNFSLDPADPANWGMRSHNPATDQGIYIGYNQALGEWQIALAAGRIYHYASIFIDSTAAINGLSVEGLAYGDLPRIPVYLLNKVTGFEDAITGSGLKVPVSCISAAAGDLDNDMDVDLFLACRGGVQNIPNIVYENRGDGTFRKVRDAGGAAGVTGAAVGEGAGTSDSVVLADYDADGFLDAYVTNGLNMRPMGVGGPHQLFRNKGNTNHWLELDLAGVSSNRDGIGARVYITTAGGVTQIREQSGGYHRWSQNHSRIHVGLAANSSADIRVEWPSGTTDLFSGVAADAIYRVTENGSIDPLVLTQPAPTPCGKPDYDPSVDQGLFLWKDCNTGRWLLRATAGGISTVYAGSFSSVDQFTNVTPRSVESTDVLDYTTDPKRIDFSLKVGGRWTDGFDFDIAETASTCFEMTASPPAPVYVGTARRILETPFDLKTLTPCVL